jgi:C4-dicarboxylate transporter DctM subunit
VLIAVLAVVVLCLFLLGVPIAFALFAGSLAYLSAGSGIPLAPVGHTVVNSVSDTTLLAIPFLMLAGNLMVKAGAGRRLIDLMAAIAGKPPGGLAVANILATIVVTDVSGSATADTAAVGSVMIPTMVARGYPASFTAALQAAAGSLGVLFPPAISMIVYGAITQTSIRALFAASFIPGFIVAGSYIAFVLWAARTRGYPREGARSVRVILLAFKDAILAILAPVFVVGSIVFGITTPAEAGVIAVIYILALGLFVYRELKLADIPGILAQSVRTTAMVMFVFSAASLLAWTLVLDLIPQQFVALLRPFTDKPFLILLMIGLFMTLLHTVVEPVPAIAAIVPLVFPLTKAAGIDPVHLGIVLMVNAASGMVMPPIGTALLVSASIARVSVDRIFREVIPFFVVASADFVLVAAFPQLTHVFRGS